MKSPIKYSEGEYVAAGALKNIIPRGSVVNSFMLFSGAVELSLSQSERFVIAHTTQYVVYEFWKCAIEDSETIYQMVMSEPFNRKLHEKTFYILQENWTKYRATLVRSALFFMLNRYSSTGLISAGNLEVGNFNPIAFSYLRNFKPKNFYPQYDRDMTLFQSIMAVTEGEYLLFPMGGLSLGVLSHGSSEGYEKATINHFKFRDLIKDMSKFKAVVLYKYHPRLLNMYRGFNIKMIDRYGKITTSKNECSEVIIANF